MKRAMQKKQEKAGKKRGAVAYAIQLKQKDVQLHGPRHLKAAMEQHPGTLSSVVTKAPDADKWEADPRFMPKAPAKVRKQVQRRPMGRAPWTLENGCRGSGCAAHSGANRGPQGALWAPWIE